MLYIVELILALNDNARSHLDSCERWYFLIPRTT